jgi:hypothetical protein
MVSKPTLTVFYKRLIRWRDAMPSRRAKPLLGSPDEPWNFCGAFFTQSWLDGSSPGDDFVSIALPQRPACLILSPTAKWRHCSRKAVKSLFVQAGKNSSKTRRGKSE